MRRKKTPFGKWVRTLFEVPNLEYKGRLSVLYSSPETFRLSSCPRDQRAKESTALPSPPPASVRLPSLALKPSPPGGGITKEAVCLLCPGFGSWAPSSPLAFLPQLQPLSSWESASEVTRTPASPGSPDETAEEGRPRWEARPIRRHFHRERARQPRPSPPKCPAFPCSLRSPPSSLPGRSDLPPGLLNQFLKAEGQKVERERKGGKPRWPRHRTQNGGGKPAGKEGKCWVTPTPGLSLVHWLSPEQDLPPAGRPPWSGRSPGRRSLAASKRRPPHFPPRPTPSQSLFRPSPDSALETTSPTYPLLLQIPCRATVTPTPVLAGSVGKRKKSPASCSARHNGSSNRLRRSQLLRELRSRATGLGGWERASEKEGVGREQWRQAGPLSRDKESIPSWRWGKKCACALMGVLFVAGRGGK